MSWNFELRPTRKEVKQQLILTPRPPSLNMNVCFNDDCFEPFMTSAERTKFSILEVIQNRYFQRNYIPIKTNTGFGIL